MQDGPNRDGPVRARPHIWMQLGGARERPVCRNCRAVGGTAGEVCREMKLVWSQ